MELRDDIDEEYIIHEDDFGYYELFNGYYDPELYLKHESDIERVNEAIYILEQFERAITDNN